MVLTPRLKALKPSIRRLASKGWSADAIARLYHITRGDVRTILATPVRPPPPTGTARRITGQTGSKVRRLHFDGGRSAAAIAAALVLDPIKVADFLERYTPREAHCRRKGNTLGRPRSAREQAALREWPRFRRGDDDGPMLETAAAPELVPIELPAVEPVVWTDGSIDPKVGKVDGTPVRRGKARRTARKVRDDDPRVKLDLARRNEVRRLAREGWTVLDLARRFEVDPTTIRDLLRGRTFKADRAEVIPPIPQASIGQRDPGPPIGLPSVPYERKKHVPGTARLTPEQRDEIRRLSREGWGIRRLANKFGMNRETIRDLLLGNFWADDPGAATPPAKPATWEEPPDDRQRWSNAKLRFEDAERMRRMRAEGASWEELQAAFGVSKATVQRILSGATYAAPPAPTDDDDLVLLPELVPIELPAVEHQDPAIVVEPTVWDPVDDIEDPMAWIELALIEREGENEPREPRMPRVPRPPREPRLSPEWYDDSENRARIAELRSRGLDWTDVGRALGCDPMRARAATEGFPRRPW
jgi:lambda repressor-like predicted transcriptional regulator